jgi:hypothetical protein
VGSVKQLEPETVPAHVTRAVDDVIRRAYLAADLGLDLNDFALPRQTIAALGLSASRHRISACKAMREVDATRAVCGVVTRYVRVGQGKAFIPTACPDHLVRPLTSWRAA